MVGRDALDGLHQGLPVDRLRGLLKDGYHGGAVLLNRGKPGGRSGWNKMREGKENFGLQVSVDHSRVLKLQSEN